MAKNKLQSFHFSMLEDFLPVGIAILERAKDGGPDKVLKGLFSSDHTIEQLRDEGFSSARLVREQLDLIIPGLGNPALEVSANPNYPVADTENSENQSSGPLEN